MFFKTQTSAASLTIAEAFVSVVESAATAAPRDAHPSCTISLRRQDHLAPRPIITLTTDYGTNDHLVGTLKGVILKINPDVTIVDISHDVTPYDLLDGALTIGSSYSYFPPRTIHVVVVDPGVGTERRPLLVTGDTQYFVAPDNGVLSLVYEREENILVRHANVEHYYLQPVSKTFHGRDVFAPIAAWLAKGAQASAMGEEITEYKKFAMPKPKSADGVSKGVVLRVDSFGNLITNFRPEDLPAAATETGAVQFTVGNHSINNLVDTFAKGVSGEPFAYIGSNGFIEIGINRGNASKSLGIGRGTQVTLATP
jgi:S-adenosyl-L-methionine hydrolase (adenosine-forming)